LDHLEGVARDFTQSQPDEPKLIVPAEF